MKKIFAVLTLAGAVWAVSPVEKKEFDRAQYYLENGGEVYFSTPIPQSDELSRKLVRNLSVSEIENGQVLAYANQTEFESFLKTGASFEVLEHPGDLLTNPSMATSPGELRLDWDKYPTYDAYVAAMYDFQTRFPELCRIVKIGESNQGRDLLYAIISDNVNTTEAEPRHMYTSAMHGDETAMYVTFLRLIDYLLTNYESDAFVKKLVSEVEIWICPLENPDGTYTNNNSTVSGARRYNDNGVDLNRHYPRSGVPLSMQNTREPEALAVIDLVDSLEFVLSMNSHGGAELLNYPYDYGNVLHPDEPWMLQVYRQLADEVHNVNSSRMTGQNNGLVRGYIWYEIPGSRMDYVTYHKNMREVTLEATSTKLVPESNYPTLWNEYHQMLLKYIEQNLFGINGTVTASHNGEPIRAKVTVVDHDNQQSFVYSRADFGNFYRPIAAGTYDVEFSADTYHTHVEENVTVTANQATTLDIKLVSTEVGVDPKFAGNSGLRLRSLAGGGVAIRFYSTESPYRAYISDVTGKVLQRYSGESSNAPREITWPETLNASGPKAQAGYYYFVLEHGGKREVRGFLHSL